MCKALNLIPSTRKKVNSVYYWWRDTDIKINGISRVLKNSSYKDGQFIFAKKVQIVKLGKDRLLHKW
jgi:hypothetical protein